MRPLTATKNSLVSLLRRFIRFICVTPIFDVSPYLSSTQKMNRFATVRKSLSFVWRWSRNDQNSSLARDSSDSFFCPETLQVLMVIWAA